MGKETIILTKDEQKFGEWLQLYYMKAPRNNSKTTSYGFKHIFEYMCKIYINNSQAKKVFHCLGYKPKQFLPAENGNEQYKIKLKPQFKLYYGGGIRIYSKKERTENIINKKYGGVC